ncbi:MAG: response regulator transcription factor [Sphingomonadales bacterium]|nr:response regulator transcription factor [Sphingomonadales bacterium]
MTEPRCIYIVDDDAAVRRSLKFLLDTERLPSRAFESGDEFLKEAGSLPPGCVLLDIRMPGRDGLEVQGIMKQRGLTFPVIVVTGHGDIGLAVRAMKAGAVDFLEKPYRREDLLAALGHACDRLDDGERAKRKAAEARLLLNALTPREREVMDGLANGHPNKTIAYDLGISPRTVEVHRANLMEKLGAHSLSDALRIAFAAEQAD